MSFLTRTLLTLMLVACLCAGASAQWPAENHYKVYNVTPPWTFAAPVLLQDQFGTYLADAMILEKFANPVQKNNEPILFPEVHQTWWRVNLTGQGWVVEVENQFGVSVWQVGDPRYLVLPARKNQPGPPLLHNHYLAYDATSTSVSIPVQLVDQFGQSLQFVVEPVLFLNPVAKTMPDGVTYPIENPTAHLACYQLEPIMTYGIPIAAFDQFRQWIEPWQVVVEDDCYLCVPSYKRTVVQTERTTWGDIKALYAE